MKEHHKKQAKQAKKDAATGRSRLKKKQRDSGIPAAWPLKEELNKEIAFHKQRALEVEAARKEARARAREAKLKEEGGGSERGSTSSCCCRRRGCCCRPGEDHRDRREQVPGARHCEVAVLFFWKGGGKGEGR